MAEAGEPDEIVCAVYTHARRHPLVLGQIAGWTPPFQLTLPQLAVIIVTALVEAQTWRFWGPHIPGGFGLLLALALPCGLAWFVRWANFEGRSLARTALGWITYLYTPRDGVVNGRPHRPARTWRPGRTPVLVVPGDER